MSRDRRAIVPLLIGQFPELGNLSSDDVHGFLNAATGLAVPSDAPNGTAFDDWRKALAAKGYPGVWGLTPAQEAQVKARGEQAARDAKARGPKTLAEAMADARRALAR